MAKDKDAPDDVFPADMPVDYASWSNEDLHAECETREIEHHHGMNKGEMVKAIKKDDKKKAKTLEAAPVDYESWTVADLHEEAAKRDIAGHATMHKDELVKALLKDDKALGKSKLTDDDEEDEFDADSATPIELKNEVERLQKELKAAKAKAGIEYEPGKKFRVSLKDSGTCVVECKKGEHPWDAYRRLAGVISSIHQPTIEEVEDPDAVCGHVLADGTINPFPPEPEPVVEAPPKPVVKAKPKLKAEPTEKDKKDE